MPEQTVRTSDGRTLTVSGEGDPLLPLASTQWRREQIHGAEARLPLRDGHRALLTDGVPQVHAWLAARP